MKRYIAALIFGLGGIAILLSLGVWQMQRLAWKEAVLAEIDARVDDAPVALPLQPDPEVDRYLAVKAEGIFTGEELQILFSLKGKGPGYRIISVFETEDRRVLVDRGYIPTDQKEAERGFRPLTVVGNLYWPDEVDSFTPEPDLKAEIWFARDIPAMAEALFTEPVLIVARTPTGDGVDPVAVDSSTIPNDHLQYAITWFLLAAVWFGMTAFLIWRIRHPTA